MTIRQNIFVIFLTVLYLCVELAFNARLLDVVGGAASNDQIHAMEVFGRSLSGTAVALVLLQLFLARRAASNNGSPGGMSIIFWCLVAGGIVFFSLQMLVDKLVEKSDPGFRKASMNIVLVQRALVNGDVVLDGLNDDPTLFSKPSGKAFLALFPVMAVSVDRLEEKIRNTKLELISRKVEEELGGPAGYYDNYVKAIKETQAQFRRYQGVPVQGDLDSMIRNQQEQAWGDYLSDLGKRGWTPSTVPGVYRGAVLNKVRKKVPVPADWDLADEAAFRDAVATKVRRKAGNSDGSVSIKGQRIPPGLGWPEFFAHPVVQNDVRKALKLPAGVRVQPAYASGDKFEREVFKPMVADKARQQLARYDAPTETYGDGGKNAEIGLDSARAVIVPPVALFFSLLGAIGHLAKLCYLMLRVVVGSIPSLNQRFRRLWPVPFALLIIAFTGLSLIDNAVTNSRLYSYMREQVLLGTPEGLMPATFSRILVGSLHVVAVGQGYGYPINERVRTDVLRGFTFGYQDAKH